MALDRPLVRPAEFPSVAWLNGSASFTLADHRGQVVLVDVFDFSCLSCLRTLPVLRDWHHRYQEAGLVILGVHTPEFPFARDPAAVRRALGRLGISWPVALDNEREIWTSFANRVWPTAHLIDRAGFVRHRREGERKYGDLEAAIRSLLSDGNSPAVELPLPLLSDADDEPSGACLPATPDLHADSVGNGELVDDEPTLLSLPANRSEGAFYLQGEWRLGHQGLTLESSEGEIALPFRAGAVHAVVAARRDDPCGDRGSPSWLEATLDGRQVEPGQFGQDLLVHQGSTCLRVDVARSYNLLQAVRPGPHDLRLRCVSAGTTLYAITFDACPAADPAPRSEPC